MIREVDAARSHYRQKYCPEITSDTDCRHLMLDSSRFGVEGTAEIIAQVVHQRWG